MSTRRRAFFKTVQLGDWLLLGHEPIGGVIRPPDFGSATWANRATATERGSSAHYRVSLKATLRRGEGIPDEPHRLFMHRKIEWLKSLVAAAGFGASVNVYEASGPLAIIEDHTAHLTTSTTAITAGSGASFSITDNIGLLSSGCWVYITDGTLVEVAQVTDWNPSGNVVQVAEAINSYGSGATVARVEWWIPEVFLAREIAIPGNEPGAFEVALNVDLTFEGRQAPEVGL